MSEIPGRCDCVTRAVRIYRVDDKGDLREPTAGRVGGGHVELEGVRRAGGQRARREHKVELRCARQGHGRVAQVDPLRIQRQPTTTATNETTTTSETVAGEMASPQQSARVKTASVGSSHRVPAR